ncbi:serine hydrolase [Paenibacillus barcinonensis]|uniref:CubicO group peptidase (Beta-lactamase class C family) n=1 Tax=Paenibacillus barcinonensis TaxID=198119 RepID=A0A2V4VAH4_PAEBA|nr:serine hydrolase [Paenibacillus barcinonensis]PYE43142.1 CubicO group peptidase (beta-lactamase class C family) [Paenibacillus barcinonensis]QKS58115.1 serine hydrolase [Paenibacillus barcinonensis]
MIRVLCALMLCAVPVLVQDGSKAAAAQSTQAVHIEVNGEQQYWRNAPLILKGTTFVPLRDVVQSVNGTLKWDSPTQTATIRVGRDTLIHRTGSKSIQVNQVSLAAPVHSRTVNGTLMVPVRAMANALKADIKVERTASGQMSVNIVTDQVSQLQPEVIRVDTYLREINYPGMALIARNGEILLKQGYGLADEQTLNRPDQKTRIASLSKSFTAASILSLAEAGKLDVQDPISTYISGIPDGHRITLHMLLSQTSGLPSAFGRGEHVTLAETVEEIRHKALKFEPGSAYLYSNSGYVLLAYVVEQVSGMSYADYVQQTLFNPLGMDHSGEASRKVNTNNGFVQEDKAWVTAPYYVSQSGSGTIYSTVDDLLKWDRALYTDAILSQDTIHTMYQPYSDKNYGYAWILKENGTKRTVFHNGSGGGFSTAFSRNLSDDVTIILLGNHAGMDMTSLLNEVEARTAKALNL